MYKKASSKNELNCFYSRAQNPPAAAAAPTPVVAPQQPRTAPTDTPSAATQESFLSAETREKALRELTDMGFDRTQSELALRASFYHVERATEYLVTVNK